MINLNLTTASRVGLNLLAVLGVVIALRLGMSIFIPTVIAVLLAAMLWPAARWLNQTLTLRWSMACMLVVGGIVLLNLLVTMGFVLAIPRMLQGLPNPRDELGQKELYKDIRERIELFSPVPLDSEYLPEQAEKSRVFQYVTQSLDSGYVTSALLEVAYYTNNWLWQWILIIFILLFLLLEGRMLSRRVVEIFGPSLEARAKAVEALSDMAKQVRTYLVWRTIINFGLAIILGLVYSFMGLHQAWVWALMTAILFYVPYLGPIAAGIFPVLDAFMNSPSPWYVLGLIVFYVAMLVVEGYIVVPVVMGRSMDLNATTVMLACLFWELVWGMPGLFLAMPLMAAVKAVCAHVPGWRPWANLMGTEEVELGPERIDGKPPPPPLEDTKLIEPEPSPALAPSYKPALKK